jgi:NADPH:quinone reductase-like Zn-dependent oxidoreductase
MSFPIPPPTMRAWIFSSRGSPRSVLTFSPSHPTPPAPTGSSLLIHISHAALNPAGPVLMTLAPSFIRPKFSIPDLDFAGTVLQCGPSAPSKYKPGTKLFGSLIPTKAVLSGKGVLAEYLIVDEETAPMGIVPEGMEMSAAAGLGSCGQTAIFLCQRAKVKEGDRVLVNGASGGVGTMTIQVARAMGASVVVGVSSGRNQEMVRSIGADEVSL